MGDKSFFIEAFFDQLDRDIRKAQELLETPRYYLEGILVLSCHIAAMAAMRFPQERDGQAYVKLVLDYSGLRSFYEQIDLLLLYQFPESKLSEHGTYKTLQRYPDIVKCLKAKYGSTDEVKNGERYVPVETLVEHISEAAPDLDIAQIREKLPLFNLAEILYRYVRCDAVHNLDFPLINRGVNVNGNDIYRANHAIDHAVLLKTASGIARNLRAVCLEHEAWPHEL